MAHARPCPPFVAAGVPARIGGDGRARTGRHQRSPHPGDLHDTEAILEGLLSSLRAHRHAEDPSLTGGSLYQQP